MTLILGLALIAAGLGLAYLAGAHDNDRARWEAQQVAAQYEQALTQSRTRHPGGRDRT